MALNNTTDRLNYIYGNNARKVERYADFSQTTSPRKEKPSYGEVAPRKQVKQKVYVVELFDRKFTLLTMLAILVIFAGALFYVDKAAEVSKLSSDIRIAKERKVELESEQVSIKSEIDKAINLDSIREYAESELGMVMPAHEEIIYYNQESSDYFRHYESVE